MKLTSKYKNLNLLQKIMLWTVCFFSVYTIMGFLIIPPIAKKIVSNRLSKTIKRMVTIEQIKINPYALSLTVNGFSVKEPDKKRNFLFFESLYVNIQSSSLFKLAPVIKEFRLTKPAIRMVRKTQNTYNFSDISRTFSQNSQKTVPKQEESKSMLFAIYNINIIDGKVDIKDKPMNKTHKIRDINISLPFISNIDAKIDIFVTPNLSASFNDTPISLSGKTKPFHKNIKTILDLNLKNIDLAHYFSYLPIKTNMNVQSGFLDIATNITFYNQKDNSPSINFSGEFTLKKLDIIDKKKHPVIKLARFYLSLGKSQPLLNKIHIKKIEISSPEIGFTRLKNGEININNLIPDKHEDSTQEKEHADLQSKPLPEAVLTLDEFKIDHARIYLKDDYKTTANPDISDILNISSFMIKDIFIATSEMTISAGKVSLDGGDLRIKRQPAGDINLAVLIPKEPHTSLKTEKTPVKNSVKPAQNWTTSIQELMIDRFNIFGENLADTTSGNLTINGINLNGQAITTKKDSRGKINLTCKINEKADINLQSVFTINPLSALVDMDFKDISLPWLQPFIKNQLNLIITKGSLFTKGRISAAWSEKTGAEVDFQGNTSINNLYIRNKTGTADILKWNRLLVDGIRVNHPKTSASISQIELTDMISSLTIKKDGNLNITDIVMPEKEKSKEKSIVKTKTEKTPGKTMPINIDLVIVKNGTVNITDKSVNPAYTTTLKQMEIKLKGLSSDIKKRAGINLSASLDNHAPLKITGSLNPLAKDLYVDLKLLFNNMELSSASPYSGKYIGEKIHKGKLSLNLAYLIDKNQVSANNVILIDKIEMGDKVKSKDAVNLPTGLAIALLKDRNGKINLDIPVTGNLNDPDFSIAGTVITVIKNLLIKAATAPFALIGHMFGSSEKINLINFHPAMTEPAEKEHSKLDTVIKALFERPGLNIEIAGYADPEKDRQAIKNQRFENIIKAEKLKKMPPVKLIPLNEIILQKQEYDAYTQKVYRDFMEKKLKTVGKSTAESNDKPTGLKADIPGTPPIKPTIEMMKKAVLEEIPVTSEDLHILAHKRALSVKGYILNSKKVDAERIFIVEPSDFYKGKEKKNPGSRVELGIK